MQLDVAFPFVVASCIILTTPGPTNTLLAAFGSAIELRRAIALPLAEAVGYGIAVSSFAALSDWLNDGGAAPVALSGVASIWLSYAAWKLFQQPRDIIVGRVTDAARRVFCTTLLNPKAMVVGTVMLPALMPHNPVEGVSLFVFLSLVAGSMWVVFGSLLPSALRPHAYRLAAVVLLCFSAGAAMKAVHSVSAVVDS